LIADPDGTGGSGAGTAGSRIMDQRPSRHTDTCDFDLAAALVGYR
jgi:hypothetical protein